MIFVAGALVGGVAGLVVGAVLQRRSAGSSVLESRGLATAIALVALVVAAVALADSDRGGDQTPAVTAAATTTTGAPAAASSTTAAPATTASGLVTVPNVSHPPRTREDAEAILQRAGLGVTIETLALSNVPAGFVISQNPLPEAKTRAGSSVLLVVSAVA
jgi:hypothetical protein